jgi:hypothetical protein
MPVHDLPLYPGNWEALNELLTIALNPDGTLKASVTYPGAALNVKNSPFNAVGNGVADDTVALNACLAAAGGAEVYFPPGDYLVTAPLVLAARTRIVGCTSPAYDTSLNPVCATKIRVGAGFTGAALFSPAGSTKGVSFANMAFVGNNIGGNIHCFRFPDAASLAGEQDWRINDCQISGFTGSAFCGAIWVMQMRDCQIMRNNYGYEASTGTGAKWLDSKIIGCVFSFSKQKNVWLGGASSGQSGALEFISCRFERAGQDPTAPLVALNTDAPGVHISNGYNTLFLGCTTDANSGDGILMTRAAGQQCASVSMIGCTLNRDGGGNQSVLANRAGYRVLGATGGLQIQNIVAIGNQILTGLADDGGGGILSPKYGVITDWSYYGKHVSGKTQGVSAPYLVGGTSGVAQMWNSTFEDLENKIMTIPYKSGAPTVVADSSGEMVQLYFDGADNKLKARVGSAWIASPAFV